MFRCCINLFFEPRFLEWDLSSDGISSWSLLSLLGNFSDALSVFTITNLHLMGAEGAGKRLRHNISIVFAFFSPLDTAFLERGK